MNAKTLRELKVSDISPNPHNPRLFWDEEQMTDLKESIQKVGVLVPITVYETFDNKYILLDGERRWRCTRELGIKTIKANIIDEPEDVTQNILYMFNIHGFKREWEIFPTALKLEVLMDQLGTKETVLASSTGLKISMIRDCKKLLWYPLKYRNVLMDRDNKISTGFFIELYPIVSKLASEDEYLPNFGLENLIDRIINKFRYGVSFVDVKELRIIRRSYSYHLSQNTIHVFLELMRKFIYDLVEPIMIFEILDTDIEIQRKNLVKQINTLSNQIESINPELLADSIFLDHLFILREKIKHLINKID